MTEPWLLGRYEIVAELGKGAMGVVYRANDPMLNRILAIKTINTEEAGHEGMAEYEARFYSEAKAAGSLNHPNIIIIYDIGKSGHLVDMAMEYIEGRELRELLAQGQSLPVVQAVDIAAQVGEGLAYAHQHQVVHRDIKPANIMITPEGRAKIADFGIARMRSSETRTQTGVIMGSPRPRRRITRARPILRTTCASAGCRWKRAIKARARSSRRRAPRFRWRPRARQPRLRRIREGNRAKRSRRCPRRPRASRARSIRRKRPSA